MARRRILALTDAQRQFLRGALNSHTDDMAAAGMLTGHDTKHANSILKQMDEAEHSVAEREAIISFALKLTKDGLR